MVAMMVHGTRDFQLLFKPEPPKTKEIVLKSGNLTCRAGMFNNVCHLSSIRGEILGVAGLIGAGRTEVAGCLWSGSLRQRGVPDGWKATQGENAQGYN